MVICPFKRRIFLTVILEYKKSDILGGTRRRKYDHRRPKGRHRDEFLWKTFRIILTQHHSIFALFLGALVVFSIAQTFNMILVRYVRSEEKFWCILRFASHSGEQRIVQIKLGCFTRLKLRLTTKTYSMVYRDLQTLRILEIALL